MSPTMKPIPTHLKGRDWLMTQDWSVEEIETALGLDAVDDRLRLVDQFLRQRFDIIGAAQGIDHIGHPRFLLQDDLRVARDPRRKIGRQRNRLVERIGMEALRPAEHRRHRLDRRADDIIIGVLLGE